MQTLRVLWRGIDSGHRGGGFDTSYSAEPLLTVTWPPIAADSIVLVSASESNPDDEEPLLFGPPRPDRFVGGADIAVRNITPQAGKVQFVLDVAWSEPLNVITDIVVLDPPRLYARGGTDGQVEVDWSWNQAQAEQVASKQLGPRRIKQLRDQLNLSAGPGTKIRATARKRRRR